MKRSTSSRAAACVTPSKQTWTPGPWYAVDVHVQSARLNEDNYVCEAEGNNREQAEANARLIAAAPELAEALRKLLDEFESRTALIETCDMPEDELVAIDNARAALAKIEGREG